MTFCGRQTEKSWYRGSCHSCTLLSVARKMQTKWLITAASSSAETISPVFFFNSHSTKPNQLILHRLTGMLIRRLLLFFGIFFELSLLDSITVLPIFFFLKRAKTQKVCQLTNCCFVSRLDTINNRLHLSSSCPVNLLRQHCGAASSTRKQARPRIEAGHSTSNQFLTLTVYRCYVTVRTSEKCVSPALFSAQSDAREKRKQRRCVFFRALVNKNAFITFLGHSRAVNQQCLLIIY